MLEERFTPRLRGVLKQQERDEAELLDRFSVPHAPDVVQTGKTVVEVLRREFGVDLPARLSSRRAPPRSRRRTGPLAIYQLKVTLRESRPPIWRRLQVQSDTTLQLLHDILQVTMGWFDTHLHQFVVDDVQYGALDADSGPDVEDEREVTIADVVAAVGDSMLYEYDFGDGWEHDVLVEKLLEPKPGATYPVCLAGRRACPPEDVGGIWQYADFVRSTSDPEDPEHAELLEWVGGAFDPDEFDAADVNAALGEIARGA